MSRFKKLLPNILSLGLLVTTVLMVSYFNKNKKNINTIEECYSKEDIPKINNNEVKESELRAVWVPFMDLQVKGEFSEDKFKQNYKNILDRAEKVKLNTVFAQVRPFSDALYPSKIFPWSHILTGTQGKSPGFDPLEFMIDETHKRNMKFHAWVVPMRVKNASFPKDLSNKNPYVIWKNENPEKFAKYIVEDKEYTYYDPGYEEVRKMIVDGVREIANNYNVDGINFDDYFYPANNLWVDRKNGTDYIKTNAGSKETEDIVKKRKENINLLVKEVYSAIKSINKDTEFGICPQGNFENARNGGADIDTWSTSEGCVDYLCPEIYTNSVNPVLPFEKAASSWKKLKSLSNIKLYAGLGLYKTGTSEYDGGSWLSSDDIIKKQIEFLRSEGYDGFSLYSSAYLDKDENKNEILNVIKIMN